MLSGTLASEKPPLSVYWPTKNPSAHQDGKQQFFDFFRLEFLDLKISIFRTVGAQVEVKLHEYKEGTPAQKSYFIELWDIGGSSHHANTRRVFYQPTNGIILVHDLTNSKSLENLQQWLLEILNKDGKDTKAVVGDIDPEQFIGSTHIPIMVVGTKADLVDLTAKSQNKKVNSSKNIAEWCSADEVNISCLKSRAFSGGTSDGVKFSRFFDKVIERKYYPKEAGAFDKRKLVGTNYSFSTSTPIKLFSPT